MHNLSSWGIIDALIRLIGDDPTREGLRETPDRVVKAWQHWGSGYMVDVDKVLKVFKDGADNYDQFILVKNIPVYSHCEHHLAPFFGVASIGYIPNGKIVGLSKFGRLVDAYARRLQVQERLTQQIAQAIQTHLAPKAVGVVLDCRHLCMESRGIQVQGTSTKTSAMHGLMLTDPAVKAEFFNLIKE